MTLLFDYAAVRYPEQMEDFRVQALIVAETWRHGPPLSPKAPKKESEEGEDRDMDKSRPNEMEELLKAWAPDPVNFEGLTVQSPIKTHESREEEEAESGQKEPV